MTKPYRVVHEDDSAFHVHDGEGQFRVAKKGLSKATLAKVQALARGGKVDGYAEGGEVPEVAPAPAPMPGGYDWWDKAKDLGSNLLQTGRDLGADTARAALTGPLMISNALADPNIKALAPGEGFQSAINTAGHALLPNLVKEGAHKEEPKKAEEPMKPPPQADRSPEPRARSGGAGAPVAAAEDKAAKAETDAAEAVKAANQAATEADIGEAHAKGAALKEHEKALADIAIQRQAMDKAFNEHFSAAMTDYDRTTKELAQTKVDPGRLWASRSTGDKMLAGIGMILGSFGAAGNGGVNRAVEVIDGAIARDIDAQKADLANRRDALGDKRNLLGMMRQKYGDGAQALNAAEATMLQRAKIQMEEVASRTSDPAKRAALAQANALIDQKLAEKNRTRELDAKMKASEIAKNYAEANKANRAGAPAAGAERAIAALDRYAKTWSKGGGLVGKATQYVSGSDAQNVEGERKALAFEIASAQAHGKPVSPRMIAAVLDQLPKAGGGQHLGDRQIASLRQALAGGAQMTGDAEDVGAGDPDG